MVVIHLLTYMSIDINHKPWIDVCDNIHTNNKK